MASEYVLGRVSYPVNIVKTANGTVRYAVIPETDVEVSAVKVLARGTVPSSALGTYTLAVKVGATSILAAATADLDGTLTAGTVASLGLTATTANLRVSAGTPILIDAVSNHADLAGDNFQVFIEASKLD